MSSYTDDSKIEELVGRTVKGIFMSEDRLTFDTDKGYLSYEVYGDCCSRSYFFDFYGVKYLLENGPVTEAVVHDLQEGDPGFHVESSTDEYGYDADIKVYGYRFTTQHPLFGPVTSVMSFRNSSNGYYGGEMEKTGEDGPRDAQEQLVGDKIG